ncbi:hypothetical protein AHAS_Ahas18G0184000 [Arachis hypogaea]
MGNSSKNPNNDPYFKTFNQGWRNHPNFGWRDQSQRQPNFNNSQGSFNQNNFNNQLSKNTHSFKQETRVLLQNLEIQVGQLNKQIPERPPNTLSSDIVPNPREECKTITLVSEPVAEKEV